MSADEEKTRVLPRKAVAAEPAAVDGDTIVFRCPNGHRIVVPSAQAGKRGLCSKCKTSVIIPVPDGAKSAPPDVAPPPTPPPGAAEPDESPAALGTPDELPAATDEAGAMSLEISEPPAAGESEDWNFIGGQAIEAPAGGSEAPWPASPPSPGLEGGSPIAQLVARLWAERQHGGIIELHLDGGSVIMPEWYDATWSRGTHGLFASPAADGSVTLTAVAWDTVRKVVVRQLTEVPDDMFI